MANFYEFLRSNATIKTGIPEVTSEGYYEPSSAHYHRVSCIIKYKTKDPLGSFVLLAVDTPIMGEYSSNKSPPRRFYFDKLFVNYLVLWNVFLVTFALPLQK
jgi:hypothetical protein